jgi:hypothetical protein
MKQFLILILGTALFSPALLAQAEAPAVFVLGEDEKVYEMLNEAYGQTLLEVAGFDTEKAFDYWLDMMKQLEAHAKKLRYDIKGVKLWLHAYWNEDGTLAHIGFMLRPESRNISPLELGAVLKTFMPKYKLPATSSRKFSHYTGANFPLYSESAN